MQSEVVPWWGKAGFLGFLFSRITIKCLIYYEDQTCLCAASIFITMKNGVCAHMLLPALQDEKLRKLVEQHGTDSWKSIAYHFPVCIWFNLHLVVLTAAHGVGRERQEGEQGSGYDVFFFVWPCFRGGQMASVSTAGRRCSTLNW